MWQRVVERKPALHEELLELVQLVGRRLGPLEAKDHPLEQIDERVERGVSVVRRPLAGREPGLLIGDMFGQRVHQPGFADSCFTGDEDDMSTAVDDLSPALLEPLHLVGAPNQRGEARVTQRFEPRARVALMKNLVDLERRGNTLERRNTERSTGEEAAHELVRQRADHHGVRRCDAL